MAKNEINHKFQSRFIELVGQEGFNDIAIKIGKSRQTVSNLYTGKFSPDIISICRIADAYNVSADYLLGRTNIKNVYTDEKALIADVEKLQSEIKKRSDALQQALGDARLYAEGIGLILSEYRQRKE